MWQRCQKKKCPHLAACEADLNACQLKGSERPMSAFMQLEVVDTPEDEDAHNDVAYAACVNTCETCDYDAEGECSGPGMGIAQLDPRADY